MRLFHVPAPWMSPGPGGLTWEQVAPHPPPAEDQLGAEILLTGDKAGLALGPHQPSPPCGQRLPCMKLGWPGLDAPDKEAKAGPQVSHRRGSGSSFLVWWGPGDQVREQRPLALRGITGEAWEP